MINTKIDNDALNQITGGRGYDRDDEPKYDGKGEDDLKIRYGVPVARWFCNSEVGRWIGSMIS